MSISTYPSQMDAEWKDMIQDIFGEYLVCASLGGRGAFFVAEKGMDIDIFVVLKDTIQDQKEKFRVLWEEFVVKYRDIHIRYGFVPDPEFPGDFSTHSQVDDILSGRGFLRKKENIAIPVLESIKDESDKNDYHILRSMIVGGRFLVGDESFFQERKEQCMEILTRYIFATEGEKSRAELQQSFRSEKEKSKFGFDKRYPQEFDVLLQEHLERILPKLERLTYIKKLGEKYVPTEYMHRWAEYILQKKFHAKHLMSFQDPYWVAKRKEIFSKVQAESHWEKMSQNTL
jgi:hypothetical protein